MKKRDKREKRVVSARDRVEKHTSGFDRTSLTVPEGVNFFSIKKPGTYRIDIIPYTTGKGNPMSEAGELYFERTYFTHRGIGPNNDTYICAVKTFNKKCPVCEERVRMAKDPDHDPQVLKDLAPKERQLFNVIDLGAKDRGVQVWDISYHLFGKLLDSMVKNGDDGEYDLFADLDQGMTLKLNVEETKQGGFSYTEVAGIEFKARKEPYDADIVEHANCLDELIKEVPYDKLKAVFLQVDAGDDNDEDEDDDEDETPRKGSNPSSKKKPPVDDDEDDEDEDTDTDDDEDDDEPAPKKKPAGKKKPVVDDDDEDEDDDTDDEDDDEDDPPAKKPPAKGKGPAHKMGLKVGDYISHKKLGLCTVEHISPDGTSLRLEDEDGDLHKAVDAKECKPADPEEDDDEDDVPPPKKGGKGKPPAGKKRPKDEEEDEDDDEDEEDEDD